MVIASITSSYPRYPGDGVGSFVHSLSSTFSGQGHQIRLLAPYDPQSSKEWLARWHVEPVVFMRPKKWSLLGHSRSLSGDLTLKWHAYPLVVLFTLVASCRLLKLVNRSRAQVIYAHWLIPGGLIGALVARMTRTPLVISLHGSDVYVAEKYTFLRPVVRFILKSVCQVTACSQDLAHRVSRLGLSPRQVTVIPYGVDTRQFQPDPQAAAGLKEELSIGETQKIVLVLGRLVNKKGFDYFIRSVPHIATSQPDTCFLIGGDGDSKPELAALVDSLQVGRQVRFLGHIPWPETPRYLNLADVVVVPSVVDEAGNVDGLPNVVLEALACGCALVASAVAGIPDVVVHNVNGLLVPPRRERAIASAVLSLLTDPGLRSRLQEAARRTVVNHLEWAQISRRILAILEDCRRSGK